VCYEELQPLQEELRTANSNAMRFNHIDPTDPKRFLNSPLAFTLGHEIRKAAYTLSNLLPLPKRMGSIVDAPSSRHATANTNNFLTGDERDIQQCKDECATISPNLSNFDGVQIPARLLEEAKGVAVMTVAKAGFGLAGIEVGTGLVVARLGDHQQWSAPCAIGVGGISWGALIGAQVSDHVFLLMTDAAVELMFNNNGNLQLGADIGVVRVRNRSYIYIYIYIYRIFERCHGCACAHFISNFLFFFDSIYVLFLVDCRRLVL
jgi:hypothetical protein